MTATIPHPPSNTPSVPKACSLSGSHRGGAPPRGGGAPAVRIHDRGDHDLADMFEIDLAEGSLSLRVDHGRGGSRAATTPPTSMSRSRAARPSWSNPPSGDIAADGLTGDQRYRTASGDLRLRGCAGRLAVDAVSGDIDIVASGELDLSARTVSGDLEVRAASLPSLRASTTSGDLKVAGRFSGEGPFAIDTVSGDALLAPVGDVRIEMTTITGDLRSELDGRLEGGRGRRSLAIGSGGPLMTFRSLSGALRVVRSVVMDRADATRKVETGAASPEPPPSASGAPAPSDGTPESRETQVPPAASEPERPMSSESTEAPMGFEPPASPSAIAPDPAPTERGTAVHWPAAPEPTAIEPAGPTESQPVTAGPAIDPQPASPASPAGVVSPEPEPWIAAEPDHADPTPGDSQPRGRRVRRPRGGRIGGPAHGRPARPRARRD